MEKSVTNAAKKAKKAKIMSIEESLKAFAEEKNLYYAAKSFLTEGLGIKLWVNSPDTPQNEYFKLKGYSPKYLDKPLNNIECIMPMENISDETFKKKGGDDDTLDRYDNIMVYACEANKRFDRDDVAKLTRAFNRTNSVTDEFNNTSNYPVIVLIRQGQYLHISTCQRSYKNDVKDKVEDRAVILYKIDYSNPRLGHLQILEKMKKEIKGCKTYESLFQKFLKSLSIDIVSDNFFKGYTKIFKEIVKYANDNEIIKSQFAAFTDTEKAIRDYVKMLMGRLVFIQFLQRKGWMGVPVGDNEWEKGDPEFLQNLFENSDDKDHFISNVLIPLFKDLNEPRNDDRANFIDKDIKVPYLNGGLFDTDEFSGIKFSLSQELMKKMLEFFRSYNFTIDENSQESVEVGVDPEMLSRIFENLLEDNKEKGAFYTPKEVVDYMCRESLTTYLLNEITDDSQKEVYKQFAATHSIEALTEDDLLYLDKKLRKVKICDPAIGSGAFPMGMLKELYECRKAIESHLYEKTWKSSEIKKDIIQNSIYGVDIEKGAVNIARLRFWLALIIDEKTPHALPNMDFKIMQGNSLLEQFDGVDLSQLELNIQEKKGKGKKNKKSDDLQQSFSFDEKFALDNIQKSIKQYYATDNHDAKISLRNNINTNIKEYILHMKDFTPSIKKKIEKLDIPNDQFFLWHIYFKEVFDNGGFDIVIGNPPYIELQKMKKMNKVYSKCGFETYNSSGDIYCLFTEYGINLLKEGGTLCYIMMNKWMKADYGKQLRNFIINRKIYSIVDYGDVQIFKKATTYPCIILLGKSEPDATFKATRLHDDNLNNVNNQLDTFKTSEFDDGIWVTSSRYDQLLFQKLLPKFQTLKAYLNYSSNYGIKTGLTDAFVITEETKNRLIAESPSAAEVIVPFLEGKDIKPYEIPQSCNYLILFRKGDTYKLMGKDNVTEDEAWTFMCSRYPSICNWLYLFKEKAQGRSDKGFFWWELRSCAYYDEFEKPKIMYQTFQVKPNFIYDTRGSLCNNSMWILPTDNKALLGLLNSKIGWWLISCYCSQIQSGHQLIWDYFSRIPIALNAENQDIADLVDKILDKKAKDNEADVSNYMNEIDCRLYQLYGLTNSEVKVIDPDAQTFGGDFELYEFNPKFKKTSDDEINKIFANLNERFNKIQFYLHNPERKRSAEYDLSKSGKPEKEEIEDAFVRWNCAILTAYRGKKQDVNENRNQELKAKMLNSGLLFRSVDGYYIEEGEDGSEKRRIEVNELSFFVTNTNAEGEERTDQTSQLQFFRTIYRLAEHYQQDSFLFTFSGNNCVAFLVATNCYGRDSFRNDIKFAGPLFKDVKDLNAWTGCSNGKIAFILEGMIQKGNQNSKVWIGEGDIFKFDDLYKPDYIIVLHDNKDADFRDICESNKKDNRNLLVNVFDSNQPTSEDIRAKVLASLDAIPMNCQFIGFHCSVSVGDSYVEGARITYDAVNEWVSRTNRNLKRVLIVDIFGDYYNL